MTNLYYSVLNNILDEVINHFEQIFKTVKEFRLDELLNPKFFKITKEIFRWKYFQL